MKEFTTELGVGNLLAVVDEGEDFGVEVGAVDDVLFGLVGA